MHQTHQRIKQEDAISEQPEPMTNNGGDAENGSEKGSREEALRSLLHIIFFISHDFIYLNMCPILITIYYCSLLETHSMLRTSCNQAQLHPMRISPARFRA